MKGLPFGSLDGIRAEMLALLRADADLTTQKQRRVTLIAAFLTLLAAVFGLVFSLLVSAGVTRPMDDTVNLASRLEGANKEYGGRILVSEATIAGASDAVEAREIDRVAVLGQNRPQAVFEIMGSARASSRRRSASCVIVSRKDWPTTGADNGTNRAARLRLRPLPIMAHQ